MENYSITIYYHFITNDHLWQPILLQFSKGQDLFLAPKIKGYTK